MAKVYIADLAAYNEGKLIGEWIDLDDYSSADEVMDKIGDLLKQWSKEQGEEREEWAIHDTDDVPSDMISEYAGKEEFENYYELKQLADDNNLPMEVVMEYASQIGVKASDIKDLPYYGTYKSEEDFAEHIMDEVGVSNPEYYLYMSDLDKRLLAQEEADNQVENMDDDDLLKMADINDADRGEEIDNEIDEKKDEIEKLENDIADLIEEMNNEDVTEGEREDMESEIERFREKIDSKRLLIKVLYDEKKNLKYSDKDEAVDKAREIIGEELYDQIYRELDRDAVGYFQDKLDYTEEQILDNRMFRVDYEKLARDLSYDYDFIEHDGDVYVFSKYAMGGEIFKDGGSTSIPVNIEGGTLVFNPDDFLATHLILIQEIRKNMLGEKSKEEIEEYVTSELKKRIEFTGDVSKEAQALHLLALDVLGKAVGRKGLFKKGGKLYEYDGQTYTGRELIDFADAASHYDKLDEAQDEEDLERLRIKSVKDAIRYLGEDEVTKMAKGGKTKENKALEKLEKNISQKWIETDMGSGWKFTLSDEYGVREQRTYLDIFDGDEYIEDWEDLSGREKTRYYNEWKHDLWESSYNSFLNMVKEKHLYYYMESGGYMAGGKTSKIKKGDLVFARNEGRNGLVGLVVSNPKKDSYGVNVVKVYFRGYRGDILDASTDELVEIIDGGYVYRAISNADIEMYQSIAKSKNLYINPKYDRIKLNEDLGWDSYESGGYMAKGGRIIANGKIIKLIFVKRCCPAIKDGKIVNYQYDFVDENGNPYTGYGNSIIEAMQSIQNHLNSYADGGYMAAGGEISVTFKSKPAFVEELKSQAKKDGVHLEFIETDDDGMEVYQAEIKKSKLDNYKKLPIQYNYGSGGYMAGGGGVDDVSEQEAKDALYELKEKGYISALRIGNHGMVFMSLWGSNLRSYDNFKDAYRYYQAMDKKMVGGYMAKGGMSSHGLDKGDKIITSVGNSVVIDNHGKEFVVNLNKGKRWSMDKWNELKQTEAYSNLRMAGGGKTKTFKDKQKAIARALFKRRSVPKAVQKDYGKTFSREEATDSAGRILGSKRKTGMMAGGGTTKKLSLKEKVRLNQIDNQIKEQKRTIKEFEEDYEDRSYDRFGNPAPPSWNEQVVMAAEHNLEMLENERKELLSKKKS